MIHPFVEDLSILKDTELENKIQEISRKYWMTHNTMIQSQLSMILEMYQSELAGRRLATVQKQYNGRDKELDKLIKVN